MAFDLSEYLVRIGLDRPPRPDADGLAAVLTAQLRGVCFENLDPLLGRVPDVTPTAVFEKIVRDGRGGYCFELNTLLQYALSAIGFAPRRVLARVRDPEGRIGARSHLALLVEARGDTWLADAGFGGPGPLAPLRLADDAEQNAPNGCYRLGDAATTGERVLYRRSAAGWVALYGFDRGFVGDADIAAANHLCATWDRAPFSSHLMLNGYDAKTRIGVFDRMATIQSAHAEERRGLDAFEDFRSLVTGRIGLVVPPDMLRAAWQRIGGDGSTAAGDASEGAGP